MESFGNGFFKVLSTPQGRDYQPALNNLALAGLCCWGASIRRLRFATPPVMQITPHAGLRKIFFDKFIMPLTKTKTEF
jgi:hypothetical protein